MPHFSRRCSGDANARRGSGSRDSHDKKHKHSSSDGDQGKRKKSKGRKRKRKRSSSSSRSRSPERARGAATLSFEVTEFLPDPCDKKYLFVDSQAIDLSGGYTPAQAVNTPSYVESAVPIHAKRLVVTWDFKVQTSAAMSGQPDLTRYTITVDRVNGSYFSPVVKFQVPLAANECGVHAQESKLMGVSIPFSVRCCPGDELCVGLTESIAPPCIAGLCGNSPLTLIPQTGVSKLELAIVKLYLY